VSQLAYEKVRSERAQEVLTSKPKQALLSTNKATEANRAHFGKPNTLHSTPSKKVLG